MQRSPQGRLLVREIGFLSLVGINDRRRRKTPCCSRCAKVRLGLNVVRSGVGGQRRDSLGGAKDRRPQGRDALRAPQGRAARSRSDESLTRAQRAGALNRLSSSNRACQTIDFVDLVRCAATVRACFVQEPVDSGLSLRSG